MGTSYNPPIVKNGLVLNIDPANIKSYPAANDANRANVSLLLTGEDILDKSLNNFTITVNGQVSSSSVNQLSGRNTYYFDGNEDWLQPPSDSAFTMGTGDFTIEGWINFKTIARTDFFDNREDGTNGAYILIYLDANGYLVAYLNQAIRISGSAGSIQANTWYHWALVRISGTTKLYVNGVQYGSSWADTTNYLSPTTRGPRLGRSAFNSPFQAPLDGYMTNIRIIKGSGIYSTSFTPSTRILETPGRIYDLTTNKRTATLTNGPIYSSSNAGKLTFDGTDDFINVGALSGSFSSFTVFVWFRPTSVSNYKNVIDCNFSYNGTTGNIGPRLEMDSTGKLGWTYSNVTNNNDLYYDHPVRSSGLPANSWHCAAITYNGTSNSSVTYYNGLNTGIARTGSATGFIGVMNNVIIGKGFHLAAATQRSLVGDCSVVQIYNRDLTATEILQNYIATKGRFDL